MTLLKRFDNPVQHEQIRALYQQSPFLFFGILFVMVVVTLFFLDRVEHELLLGWLAVNVGLTLARVALVKRFQHKKPADDRLLKWGVLFALSSTVSGAIWGSIAVLFMDPANIETVLLVAIVLTGMTAGSLVPLSAFIPAYMGFTLFAMSPLALVLWSQASDALNFIGYLVLAFIVVNLGYAFVVNRNQAESIRLRFENLDLLEDLQQQKELAEQANTDKSRFLAATSHDLRQPLHAMDLYLGALSNMLSEQEQRELLDKSRQASAALNQLLTALMDVSRLDAGDIVIERKPCNIKRLLSEVIEECNEQAEQAGIELQMEADDTYVDTDPLMLTRMLRNLLNNACRHSQAKVVSLQAARSGRDIVLSVCDDGVGIASAKQQQVFSEFYQINNPERDRSKGLGLGLAIVKRLADILQHELWLDSAEGKGSCFRLKLPYLQGVTEQGEDATDIADNDISGSFIILIDDEAGVRDAMRSLLRQWGCELLIADSVDALQQELQSLDYPCPDMILADYRLRENTTGLDAVKLVRGMYQQDVPAVIISGDTDVKVKRHAEAYGAYLLHKPVQPGTLRDTLAKVLGL